MQNGINSATNRTTQRSQAQLPYGYKPRSIADAALLGTIQSTLDHVDLRELRKEAKRSTDAEQAQQKAKFDARGFEPPKYVAEDIVMVSSNPAVTEQSKKLTAKKEGPLKIVAVLPNDRYEVEDLRDLQKSKGQRSVVSVDSLCKWVTFDALK